MVEGEGFCYETKPSTFVNPNKENALMVPNHEKKGDYYVNLRLSQLKNELQF